jgi:REP element-mobilizing transposase RayT
MSLPIVIAHHLVWTLYGWWLPNDPRGSMSQTIRNDIIADLGKLHFGRKKVQPASGTIREFYERAASTLLHPLLSIGPSELVAIGQAFRESISLHCYTCYACAIMPDHIHILIRKHKHLAEQMIWNLQEASRLRLRDLGLRPTNHPVWGGPGWKVFQDHPDDIRRTIKYIDDNPLPLRMPRQQWEFVTPYDGWPLHPGHNPNSPYARRLRGK